VGRVQVFNPLTHFIPSHITRSPWGPMMGRGGLVAKKKAKKKKKKYVLHYFATNAQAHLSFLPSSSHSASTHTHSRSPTLLSRHSVYNAITEAHTRTTTRQASTVALLRSLLSLGYRAAVAPLSHHYRFAATSLSCRCCTAPRKLEKKKNVGWPANPRVGPYAWRDRESSFAIPNYKNVS